MYQNGNEISYIETSAELTELKKKETHKWLNEVSCVPPQQTLRHLQTAFKNFFEKRTGYPVFKKKRGTQAAEYTRSAFKWDKNTQTITFAKIGKLKIRWSRDFQSNPSTVTITKDCAGRYFVSLCLDETFEKFPKTKQAVGIDSGINRLMTLSTGERIPNPKYHQKKLRKLARAQRILSKRQKGSQRYEKAKLCVAKIQAKISDTRTDYLHKATTDLVRRFDVIGMEDLQVRKMGRNHKLARSLADASFGTVRQFVAYKCERYGKKLITIDPFFPSSKRCSKCGYIVEKLPLAIREWDCPSCQTRHDRDENASINILAAGHAVTARGEDVSRSKGSPLKRKLRRIVNPLGKSA